MGDAWLLVWQALFVQRHMRNLLTHRALQLGAPRVRLAVTAECTGCYEYSGRRLHLFKVGTELILNAF